ncbi:2-keto-4-pentenoate hydratase [Xanthomonas arboricola]|nr:2-keto-4-pentenoate hydratase [Xanthomonas arboricola]
MSETDLVVDVTVGSQFAVVSSPLQSHHYLLNTLGQYALAAVNIKTGDLISNTSTIRPMRWYVE